VRQTLAGGSHGVLLPAFAIETNRDPEGTPTGLGAILVGPARVIRRLGAIVFLVTVRDGSCPMFRPESALFQED
jgi:hypothetical protein